MISEQTKDEVVNAYNSGVSMKHILIEFSVDAPSVYLILATRGIPLRSEIRKASVLVDDEEIVRMSEVDGLSAADISRKTGIRYNKVLQILSIHDVIMTRGGEAENFRKMRREVLRDLFPDDGVTLPLSIDDIVTKYGITLNVLYRIIGHHPKLRRMGDMRTLGGRFNAVVEEVMERVISELGK